ncbi:MAG TPA: endonuclease III [Candidatus Krumholzibacteria bacterium]|nr:endonuclease III [Candidatus Krumholzibacteria bacterium]
MKRVTARSQRRKAPRVPKHVLARKGPPKQGPPPRPKKKVTAKRKPLPVVATPELRRRALRLHDGLKDAYPDARCELDFTNALEALVSTILAAQCTDARVNMVTPALFKKYPTARDYLNADDDVLKEEIKSTGFFNNKTKAIKAAAKLLVEEFSGEMPRTMEDLLKLPGVGRKTANVILANIYGVPGVVVDTHMLRLSNRMGFSVQHDADKVEKDMMAIFPESTWISLSHLIPWHGRRCCTARNPNCDGCPVADECPKLIE